jgi:polysaccharide deactylase WbmS-like protein
MSFVLDPPRLSRHLWESPAFSLTADQDWAPPWASQQLLTAAARHGVPLHVFRTNPCPVLDDAFAAGRITQGWHPNFLPGSSHGGTPQDVIAYCRSHFPSCRTVRAHCFMEHTLAWDALAAAGIVADSQVPTYFQEGLAPLLHASGIWRFPVYFEDDIFFRYFPDELSLSRIEGTLFGPGLKILNFHPTFVAANVPSLAYYDRIKSRWFSSGTDHRTLIHPNRGTRNVLEELTALVQSRGFRFDSFEHLVDRLPACRSA